MAYSDPAKTYIQTPLKLVKTYSDSIRTDQGSTRSLGDVFKEPVNFSVLKTDIYLAFHFGCYLGNNVRSLPCVLLFHLSDTLRRTTRNLESFSILSSSVNRRTESNSLPP